MRVTTGREMLSRALSNLEINEKGIFVFSKEYSLGKKSEFMCEAAIRLEMKMPAHLLPLLFYTHALSQWDMLVAT